jgi:Ni,Fe-hydrogenase maturation factor
MKLLVFGNILVKEDNLALKLIPRLRKEFPNIEFKEFDPTENLEAEIEDGKLYILDVVQNIKDPLIIKDFDQLQTNKVYSMHDFDLAFNLKLLKKIGKLKEIEIIGLPTEMDEEKAITSIGKMLMNHN